MEITVEYWIREQQTVTNENGFRYLDDVPVLKESRVHEVETEEDLQPIFEHIYNANNRLKYCNGYYWQIKGDPMLNGLSINNYYQKRFFDRYHTIENYYRGGVVD